MKTCDMCGDDIAVDAETRHALVASGGWCCPSDTVYDLLPKQSLCSDCSARLAFAAELGFDPGKNGENLKIRREL